MPLSTPIRVCTSSEMRELDRQAEVEFSIDASILMENAGRAAAQIILEKFPHAGQSTEILIFAGKGNNAGDAFVVARRLICLDRKVRVFHLCGENIYAGATRKNFEILRKLKGKLTLLENAGDLESFFKSSAGPFTVVDGIIGTGLKGNLEGIFYDVVELLNRQNPHEVIALDIPSGVSGDTGQAHGNSIQASLTVSFGFPKLGHFLPPGAAKRGELINVDISLPPRFRKEGDTFLLMRGPMSNLIRERDRYGHKNSFGHSLIVGGSRGRLGAVVMAARASHRMGTGLVTVATWEDCMEAMMIKLPMETMSVPLRLQPPELEKYRKNLSAYTSVVVGPGLSMRADGKTVMEELLVNYKGPLVIDADGLNLIGDYQLHDLLRRRTEPTVLTPHPGEMARLLNISKEKVTENPIQSVKQCIEKTHSIVLLKGAATLIGSVDEVIYLNHYPNDGMATAGSGDVLAGMIGGLLGQRMDPFQATLLGVYLHSLAGEITARQLGHRAMTAPDMIDNIAHAFKELKETTEPSLPVEGHAQLL